MEAQMASHVEMRSVTFSATGGFVDPNARVEERNVHPCARTLTDEQDDNCVVIMGLQIDKELE
jgi:hypothetical protein